MTARLSIIILGSLTAALQLRAHPGSLDEYPERFPGKTLQQIVLEWDRQPDERLSEAALSDEVSLLVKEWIKLPPQALSDRITKALKNNRMGDYRKRFANILQEMAELLGAPQLGQTQEVQDFLVWREAHLFADDGFHKHPPASAWDEKPEQKEQRLAAWNAERDAEVAVIQESARTASSALKAHWLVQCAALEFRHRRYGQAEAYLRQVRTEFPSHPRAEVATVVWVQLKMDQWLKSVRYQRVGDPATNKLQDEFWALEEVYRKTYPQGRFLADLDGWVAGVHRGHHNFGSALGLYLKQAKTPDHPEVRRRAFQQIEWLLADIAEEPNHLPRLPWDAIASEPVVALRMGYFMLDAMSTTDLGALMHRQDGGDHRALEKLQPVLAAVRGEAMKAWPLLDQALAVNHSAYGSSRQAIRTVLHSWSAITRGQPELALGMLPSNATGPGADDVRWARIVACKRAGRHVQVQEELTALLQTHPKSKLCIDAGFVGGESWVALRDYRTALLEFWKCLERHECAEPHLEPVEDPHLHLEGEITQRIHALLNFAPFAHLEEILYAPKVSPILVAVVSSALRLRYLCDWKFEEAAKVTSSPFFEPIWAQRLTGEPSVEALSAPWTGILARLQTLTGTATAKQAPETSARSWLALGQEWAALKQTELWQGSVLSEPAFVDMRMTQPSFELRKHGAYVHIPDEKAAEILDMRHPQTHAIRCFRKALEQAAGNAEIELAARLGIHEALRDRAESSPYFMDRAVEVGDQALDHQLVTAITKAAGHADACWWTFRPSSSQGEWKPGANALFRCEQDLAHVLSDRSGTDYWDSDWKVREGTKKLMERLTKTISEHRDLSGLKKALSELRAELRVQATSPEAARLYNHLDDLESLAGVPGVDMPTLQAYYAMRLTEKPLETADPRFESIPDFIAFWNYAVTPSNQPMTEIERNLAPTPDERPARQLRAQAQKARMAQFLKDYPQSPKREAATARLAINTLREARFHCGMARGQDIETPPHGYVGFKVQRGVPFHAASVFQSLDDYDRQFPNGRYSWDVRLARGIAHCEANQWLPAIKEIRAPVRGRVCVR